ncbi:MAG: alpha/beta hydrolase [Lysinibacillus sp.]
MLKNYIQYNTHQKNEIIVALPALGERKEMYEHLANALPSVQIVAIDLPGHNGQLENDFSFQTYAKTIKEIMDHLQITKAHFLGNSIGAWMIQHFYVTYPSYVHSLTLLDGGYYFLGDEPKVMSEIQLPIIGKIEDLQEAIRNEASSMEKLSVKCQQTVYEYFLHNFILEGNMYRHHSNEQALNYLSKTVVSKNYCIQQEGTLPILLVLADDNQDESLHEKLQKFQELHPNSKTKIIHNSYHFLPLTNPVEAAKIIDYAVLKR